MKRVIFVFLVVIVTFFGKIQYDMQVHISSARSFRHPGHRITLLHLGKPDADEHTRTIAAMKAAINV